MLHDFKVMHYTFHRLIFHTLPSTKLVTTRDEKMGYVWFCSVSARAAFCSIVYSSD